MNNFETLQLPWLSVPTNSSCQHLSRLLGPFDILISIAVFLSILRYDHAILALAIFNIFKIYHQVLVAENNRILQDLIILNVANLVVQLGPLVEQLIDEKQVCLLPRDKPVPVYPLALPAENTPVHLEDEHDVSELAQLLQLEAAELRRALLGRVAVLVEPVERGHHLEVLVDVEE